MMARRGVGTDTTVARTCQRAIVETADAMFDQGAVIVDIGAGAVLGYDGRLVRAPHVRRASAGDFFDWDTRVFYKFLRPGHELLYAGRPADRRVGHQAAEMQIR